MAKDDDLLKEAKEAFSLCSDTETHNREAAKDDLRFARLGEQWPDYAVRSRGKDRPMLTINKLPAFIRQVVNDVRQNKPQIKVKPVDDKADPMTAAVLSGLIRNIEYMSNADIAYDTACDFAVSMGFGYIRVAIEYACDDTFDKDILIQRVANPFSVYGDPYSTAADSSDWNVAFITDLLSKDAFNRKYKGADPVNWSDTGSAYAELQMPWMEGNEVLVAEWWQRDEVAKKLLKLSNGEIVFEDRFTAPIPDMDGMTLKDAFALQGITPVAERPTRGYKITQRIMSGAEILEENDWAGRYIPIIPVYGEELNVEGKRYFRSLIRDAKDAQSMHNFWRTATTELVALAPKAPWIGPRGAFKTDIAKWETANTENHAFIEFDPVAGGPPQRQPFAGMPAGALQEALNASDDMKAIMGLYDASLGARSNETSGVAINTRQREGDVSTFHFVDNINRAIRHTGRVLIDLIPLVYSEQRIARVLGDDGTAINVRLGPAQQPPGQPAPMQQSQPAPPPMPGQMPPGAPPPPTAPPGSPLNSIDPSRIYDVTVGKYDVAVESGPAYTTLREEAREGLTEVIRSYPPAAPILGPMLLDAMDFPHAQEAAAQLRAVAAGGTDPEKQKLQQQVQALTAKLQAVQGDHSIDAGRLQVDAYKAQTDRLEAVHDATTERIRTIHEITQPIQPPNGAVF